MWNWWKEEVKQLYQTVEGTEQIQNSNLNSQVPKGREIGTLGFIKPICSPSTKPMFTFLGSSSSIVLGRGQVEEGCTCYTSTVLHTLLLGAIFHSLSLPVSTQKNPNNYFDTFLHQLTQKKHAFALTDCQDSIIIYLFTLLLFKFSAL